MTIQQMKAFMAVCREGSVTKASQKLMIAQPAVSRTIKDLQKQCNYQLFDLVGNKLRPTENALKILDDVIDVLKRIEYIESRLYGNEHTTTLKVGCNMSTGIELLPTAISVFENRYSNTVINVFEDSTPNVIGKLLTRELDFAIVSGIINDVKLSCKCFAEEPFCWICNANNPIAEEKNVSIERLPVNVLCCRVMI